jgi:hypothetical protein
MRRLEELRLLKARAKNLLEGLKRPAQLSFSMFTAVKVFGDSTFFPNDASKLSVDHAAVELAG